MLKNDGVDRWYYRAQWHRAFFRLWEWPTQRKHKERKRRDKGGERNINETGVKEKYWVDVVVQMQNERAHVNRGGGRGEQKKARFQADEANVHQQ